VFVYITIFLVLLGVGKTVLKYFAKDDGMLSFANNKPVKIFSKGAGTNPDLWGVMVRNNQSIQMDFNNLIEFLD